jgi:hypothetical protein
MWRKPMRRETCEFCGAKAKSDLLLQRCSLRCAAIADKRIGYVPDRDIEVGVFAEGEESSTIATLLSNGSVLVTGGTNGTALATAELYQ